MAFFKFRNGAEESAAPSAPAPSIESIRQRAKYRLVGAAVLVLAGVIVFPLLLDSQPRPVAVDMPIDIPDKNKMPPLLVPSAPAAVLASAASSAEPVASGAVAGRQVDAGSAPVAAVSAATEIRENAAPAQTEKDVVATKNDDIEVARTTAKTSSGVAKVASTPVSKPASAASRPALSRASEAARAKAVLEGAAASPSQESDPAAAEGRFVVQVGAFADAVRAREVRLKVEHAGLKTYTHVAETKDGRRIRVRVGPFPTRAEAEQAAAKIKKLDLPAALLTL
jgi:DedD protein